MPEGSHVAKSKSGQAGTDVRRTEQDHFANDHEIMLSEHHVLLQGSSGATDNLAKAPRSDNIERASRGSNSADDARRQRNMRSATAGSAGAKQVYDTDMPEMNFPARLIHLKVENDAVRAQLESLQSVLQNAT
jgi:hypothetical protein